MNDAPAPRRVSDTVHADLRAQILDGRLAPGDAVPSERALAEDHGVNRHAVREALKRLQQAGLVRISQGGATRVQDWRDHGGMDLLLDLVLTGGPVPPVEVLRSVLELRALVGVDVARRFVAGAEASERERAARLVEASADAVGGPPARLVDGYAEVWRALVDGTGNLAYRLMLNSLNDALATYPELSLSLLPGDVEALRRLAIAIRTGDVDGAVALVAAQLEGDVPPAS